jgi:exopolysaccharide biosynthesis polyprenyl glycosylphosphotransferase
VQSEAVAQTAVSGVTELQEGAAILTRVADQPHTPSRRTTRTRPSAHGRPSRSDRRGGNPLRRILIGFDLFAFTSAWVVAISAPLQGLGNHARGPWNTSLQIVIAIGAAMGAMALQRLYLARVCSIRAEELSRSARAAVASAVMVAVISSAAHLELSTRRVVVGAGLGFLAVGMLRGIYSSMLRERRARGLHRRPIVIIGTNTEARELANLIATHPEFGYQPVGIVGDDAEYAQWATPELPYLGGLDRVSDVTIGARASGVLIAASGLKPPELKAVTRDLLTTDLHVHISSGLWGIDHRRLRSVPLAHEPIFYLEKVSLSRVNKALKRTLDVAVAVICLLVAAPVILVAALAVKLHDRGPVFFRQVRVGRDGQLFSVFKLRTMVPNAENLLPELREESNLRDGPLFKMDRDPRQTKVGRILEAASIDELPQLFNVLQGSMSLVGPRPALPSEVAQFDEELLERFSVPPGITGLWQVEARDNPAFSAYRRLDLFYVENWSITLDLAILVETFSSVLSRPARGRH